MVPYPVTGEVAALAGTAGAVTTTDSDRPRGSTLSPSIPLRNHTQTPPGTAVRSAQPTDQVSGARSDARGRVENLAGVLEHG